MGVRAFTAFAAYVCAARVRVRVRGAFKANVRMDGSLFLDQLYWSGRRGGASKLEHSGTAVVPQWRRGQRAHG